MKKLILLLVICSSATGINAQERLLVKQGQTLEYTVQAGGSVFPMTFDIDSMSQSRVELSWQLSQSNGRFIMLQPSLDSAAEAYWEEPIDFQELVMPSSKNLVLLSRKTFKSLKENKKAVFDGAMLSLVTAKEPFTLNGKIIDALYAESESGLRIWILNHPELPLMLRIENNPFRVDAILDRVKNNIKLKN